MRKIAFVSIEDEPVKKVMLHEENPQSVFVFGYNTVFDSGCDFDYWYANRTDAEEVCYEEYNIQEKDWIIITDVHEFCQQDLIMPVRVKGRENGIPQWGHFEILANGKWIDYDITINREQTLKGLTGNERLWFSGLLHEFDEAIKIDKEKAQKILEGLSFDTLSIKRILNIS